MDTSGFVTSVKELNQVENSEFGGSNEEEVLSLSGIYKFPTRITKDYNAQYDEPLSPKLIKFWLSQIKVSFLSGITLGTQLIQRKP